MFELSVASCSSGICSGSAGSVDPSGDGVVVLQERA